MVEENSEESFFGYLLPRYFVHGLLFSLFGFIIGFLLVFIFLGLFVFGAFIGLIIGFLLLFLVLGGINAFLMDKIWNIQINENWKSMMVHRFALAVVFLTVSIPSFIISLYAASLPVTIVLFIIYCFIDGYVAKAVGSYWKISSETGRSPIRLGFLGTLMVLLLSAMAGTGFVVGLLLLVWQLIGGTLSGFLLFVTGFSGLVTLIGIVILGLSREQVSVDEQTDPQR
jgi:hypothetical protein